MTVNDISIHECGGYNHPTVRTVSWNSTGNWLAAGEKIFSFDTSQLSQVLVISTNNNNASINRVRFHPSDQSSICTTSNREVRIFDIRGGVERAVGKMDLQASYIDWCPTSTGAASYLAVTTRDSIQVFDTRKLNSTKSTPISTFRIPDVEMDACIFSKRGNHLVAATANKGEIPSDLRIWSWKEGSDMFLKSIEENTQYKVPAHAGPIFSMTFSPDGKRLATGGADSIVGVWDTATMCCTATISRRYKMIDSVAFSHDSRFLGACNEEDGIDISNPLNGEQVGLVQLRENPGMGGYGGGTEVAFSPNTNSHIIACARTPTGSNQSAAAVVIKCRISNQ